MNCSAWPLACALGLSLALACLAPLAPAQLPAQAPAQLPAQPLLKAPRAAPQALSADSAALLTDYWLARRRGARAQLLVGGGLALAGGTLWAASAPQPPALRSAGILATGAGALTLPLAAVQLHRLRRARLQAYLSGRRPVPPALWCRAHEHGRRASP